MPTITSQWDLDTVIDLYYGSCTTDISRILYKHDLYAQYESPTTIVYMKIDDQEVFHGTLIRQLHSGQCLTGELLFPYLKNHNWLHLGPVTCTSTGHILFDAQVNVLKGMFWKEKMKNALSASWIFKSDHEFIMLYVDPAAVVLSDPTEFRPRQLPPRTAIDLLNDVDDELIKLKVVLRKHTSLATQERTELIALQLFVIHVKAIEVISP
ncbi:hypothetical protein F5146DRAFT_1149931 [Armillaria mellea]|nr:hypothetical protein F5146DRAFT_1149931 [Armillaria mellea]